MQHQKQENPHPYSSKDSSVFDTVEIMASLEIVDSGRVSGGRSSFSQKCSLLSQYLKEKGSFGELSLGLTQTSETKGTMNLLPMIEKSGQNSGLRSPNVFPHPAAYVSGPKPEAEMAQMTIFYAGQVIVFDNFPADKAKEIMKLAGQNAAFAPPRSSESAPNIPNIVPAFGLPDAATAAAHPSAQPPLGSDLPIARKNSLARFLEKRKDRITANAPYQVNKPAPAAASKPVKAEGWLGLAAQYPLQRH